MYQKQNIETILAKRMTKDVYILISIKGTVDVVQAKYLLLDYSISTTYKISRSPIPVSFCGCLRINSVKESKKR